MSKHSGIIGSSRAMKNVLRAIERAASVDMPVLIEGETGTGKELVAREIHATSKRAKSPLVAVNTGAISRELVVGELFGHAKGAFTGATETVAGRFAEANNGTLFLDEVATMEQRVQVALLRVLETGRYRPVGGDSDKSVDVRIIAAANVSLDAAAEEGTFRRDLLYRLGVFRIALPPLRERSSDIPALVDSFVAGVRGSYAVEVEGVAPDALDLLCRYTWPGNIRELKNVIAQACVLATPGCIKVEHLPRRIRMGMAEGTFSNGGWEIETPDIVAPGARTGASSTSSQERWGGSKAAASNAGAYLPLGESLEEVRKIYTLNALRHCGNNKTQTAKTLRVSRKSLYDMLLRWGYKEATRADRNAGMAAAGKH